MNSSCALPMFLLVVLLDSRGCRPQWWGLGTVSAGGTLLHIERLGWPGKRHITTASCKKPTAKNCEHVLASSRL